MPLAIMQYFMVDSNNNFSKKAKQIIKQLYQTRRSGTSFFLYEYLSIFISFCLFCINLLINQNFNEVKNR